jgi:rhodanese-related sulfurtransferase
MVREPDGVIRLQPSELSERLERGERLTVLDVREDVERGCAAIAVPGTAIDLFIPMGQVMTRVHEISEAPGGGPVVVYCHHGVRSMAVATWLVRQGLSTVYNLEGGIDAWSLAVDPRVRRY